LKKIIETKRLYLREMTPQDFDALYKVLADSDIMRHYPYTFDDARVRGWIEKNIRRYREDGFGLWAVCLKENDEMIGDCGLTLQSIDGVILPEIGYHIRSDCQRKGYASEAAAAVRDHAFEHTAYDAVYSYCTEENEASRRTAEAIGMRFSKAYRDQNGATIDVSHITRDEWAKLESRTVWSGRIQGIQTLYLSRQLRFDDRFFERYRPLLALDESRPLRILEIGCGPGALAAALHRWYPKAEITAVDRDSAFVDFAKAHISGVDVIEGDATHLPFADGTFDVTISNTVSEHIDPAAFYGEQLRVLKRGGVCLVLSARKGFVHRAACLKETAEEEDFWNSVTDTEKVLEKYGVGRYHMSEAELPRAFENAGFTDVRTGYAVIDLTPDDPRYDSEMALAMMEAERMGDIEAVQSTQAENTDRIIGIIHKKHDERLRLYKTGEKQWDTCTSVTMIVRGVKP